MIAVVQRVTSASVTVGGAVVGRIDRGLMVLVGIARGDGPADLDYTASKVVGLRIFADDEGRMNRSVADVAGALLVVSQFTLLGDVRKGRRPAFDAAAPPEEARVLYELLIARFKATLPDVSGAGDDRLGTAAGGAITAGSEQAARAAAD